MPSPTAGPPPATDFPWPDPARRAAFDAWFAPLAAQRGLDPSSLAPASVDASFRRYGRVRGPGGSCIVMDAPPPHEDVRPFVALAHRIGAAGLHAPQVLAVDNAAGFLLLEDLGSTTYLDAFRQATPAHTDALMRDAVAALVRWQAGVAGDGIAPFDEAQLRGELELFPLWCVQHEYGREWTEAARKHWARIADLLVAEALRQPQVVVHADFMARNLMVCEPNPGLLDFQDARVGPVTYDIASLLRDAFWSWDEERELDWAVRWWRAARDAGLFGEHRFGGDFGDCWRGIEWMGLQRHLRILGVFCRLKHRDGKPHYAADLPRFFGYAAQVALRYRELAPLLPLLEDLVGPLTTQGFSLR